MFVNTSSWVLYSLVYVEQFSEQSLWLKSITINTLLDVINYCMLLHIAICWFILCICLRLQYVTFYAFWFTESTNDHRPGIGEAVSRTSNGSHSRKTWCKYCLKSILLKHIVFPDSSQGDEINESYSEKWLLEALPSVAGTLI